ncbi:hypothetical protein [Marinifilum fragile]|uniref:hypothetical protein n=1 Tax=Marinifilum fragile TaxID=570161 RepID=UPI002AA67BAE|nr:hypothetical protein [Marinifilum fragile]
MEENVTTIELPKKRPTFLTVLCILSFIGSGFLLGSNIYQYFMFDTTYAKQMKMLETQQEALSDAGIESGFAYNSIQNGIVTLEKTSQNLGLISGANILFALLSLLGVFLMFKMSKNGFYLYTFANLFWLLVPLALIDFEATMMNTAVLGFFTIVFIIMYAVNLKHMK